MTPRWIPLLSVGFVVAACAGAASDKTGGPDNLSSCTSPADETSSDHACADSNDAPSKPARDAGSSSSSSGGPVDSGPVCNATTCAAGCCVAGHCFTDHTSDHCATGGGQCPAACGANESCQSKARVFACAPSVKPDQVYEVTLVSVAVSPAADVYVNDGVSAFGSLAIPRTDTRNGATVATWNKVIGKLRADQIIDKTVTLEVKDDLAFRPDRLIGTCSHILTIADVTAGTIDIKTPECNGEVQDASFTLKPSL